jgi:hypothetical protein
MESPWKVLVIWWGTQPDKYRLLYLAAGLAVLGTLLGTLITGAFRGASRAVLRAIKALWYMQEYRFFREWTKAQRAEELKPQSNNPYFFPLSIEQLSEMFGRTPKKTEKLLKNLEKLGLVAETKHGWGIVKKGSTYTGPLTSVPGGRRRF